MRSLPTSVVPAKPVLDVDPSPTRAALELDCATWKKLFAFRDRLARRAFYRYGQRIPLAEFWSMGNLVMAECWAQFQEIEEGCAFTTMVYRRIAQRMATVAREEWGTHGERHKPQLNNVNEVPFIEENHHGITEDSTAAYCDGRTMVAHLHAIATPAQLGLKLERLSPGASYQDFAVKAYFRTS